MSKNIADRSISIQDLNDLRKIGVLCQFYTISLGKLLAPKNQIGAQARYFES